MLNASIVDGYSHIVIGSGPVSLLEALSLHAEGKQVLILEERPVTGGAWGFLSYPDWPPVEIGCHIWDLDPRAVKFIQEYLGLSLPVLEPQPRLFKGGRSFFYKWKHTAFEVRNAAGALKRGQLGTFFKSLTAGVAESGKNLGKKYVYPEGGAHEFIEAIHKKVEEAGIAVQTNSRVNRVDLSGEKAKFHVNEQVFEAEEVILTSFSSIDALTLPDGEQMDFPSEAQREWVHYHLLFDKAGGKPFSYDRLMDHHLIHRISDINGQMVNNLPGWQRGHMILVGVHDYAFRERTVEQTAEHLDRALKNLGYVSGDAQLLTYHQNSYFSRVVSGKNIDDLAPKCLPQLRFIPSTNLMYSIGEGTERWGSLRL